MAYAACNLIPASCLEQAQKNKTNASFPCHLTREGTLLIHKQQPAGKLAEMEFPF